MSTFLIHTVILQVKIDWENINAKVEAEYRQERERPAAASQLQQVRS